MDENSMKGAVGQLKKVLTSIKHKGGVIVDKDQNHIR